MKQKMKFIAIIGLLLAFIMNKSRFGYGADAYLSNWTENHDYWEFSNQSIENYKVKYSKYGLQPLLNINYNFTDHFYISAEVKGFIGVNEQTQDKGIFSKSYNQTGIEADIIDQMMFFVGFRF